MKSSRRSTTLQELLRLVRWPEEGARNVGAFLAANADELALALGTTPEDLHRAEEMPDEVVVPSVRTRLGRGRELEREQKAFEDSEAALRAAATLGCTVRWTGPGAVIDADVLLGELLRDRSKRYLAFMAPDFVTVVERDTLARTRLVRRMFLDAAAWVDAAGLHIRWRGGRGGYNWKPQTVVPKHRMRVLTVELRPAVTVPLPEAGLGELLQHAAI